MLKLKSKLDIMENKEYEVKTIIDNTIYTNKVIKD